MKTLIIYDSLYGNTEKIAKIIGEAIGEAKVANINSVEYSELKNYDLLIVGSPTHGGRPSEPMKKFLAGIPEGHMKDLKVAGFDTGIPKAGQNFFLKFVISVLGYAAKHIAKSLEKKGGTVVSTKTFFVADKKGPLRDGELEAAGEWAKKISQSI